MAARYRPTAEWVAQHQAKHSRRNIVVANPKGEPQQVVEIEVKKRAKYRNTRVEIDGRKFDSILEGEYYKQLALRWRAGEVRWYSRQVQFDLPGGRVYRADFVVFLADGGVDIIDCKGCDDPMSKLKRDQVEDIWKVKVTLIRKEDTKVSAG